MSEVEPDAKGEVADTLHVGAQFNKYTIVRLIGVGGMGAVYEATHTELNKRVALKTLRPTFAQDPEIRARFLREGKLASRIHHPNVVDVTDFGTQDDVPFLVMEYLDGMSLEDRIKTEGRLDPAVATDVILGACAGIAAAHEQGVIHRDIKPANIFLLRQRGGDYRVKIVDFGISKATEKSIEGNLTSTGRVVGTPFYIAPEQIRSSKEVDARADQYSLGVTFYEALCGRKPFVADSLFEIVCKITQGEYVLPREVVPDIPEGLQAIVLKMMAIDPDNRFESLRDCGRALLPFATERGRVLFATEFGDRPTPEVLLPPRPDATAGLRTLPSNTEAGAGGESHAMTGSGVAALARTGQIFEVSKVPEPPSKKELSKAIPLALLGALAVGGLAVWTRKQQASAAPHESQTPRATLQTTATSATVPDYTVSITATPSDAWIVVDNQFTVPGEFSRSFARDGQRHRVTVRAAGYLPQTFEFTGPIVRHVTLERDPAAASAPILSHTTDASVSVANGNGSTVGRGTGRSSGTRRTQVSTRTNDSTATSTSPRTGADTANPTTTATQHGTNNAPILN